MKKKTFAILIIACFAINASSAAYSRIQNSPNPFQNNTIIRFKLADEAINASICIFDMQGKMLKNIDVTKGEESVSLDGYEFGKGLYLYSLIVNGQEIDTKKMIII